MCCCGGRVYNKMSSKKKQDQSKQMRTLVLALAAVSLCAVLGGILILIGKNVKNDDNTQKEEKPEVTAEEYEQFGWHDFTEYFSKGLNEDGTLKDVQVQDYVTLCDYASITIPEGTKDPEEYVINYLLENCQVKECESYRKIIEERLRFVANYNYEYNDKNYYEAYEKHQYEDVYDAYQMTEEEFNAYISQSAETEMKKFLILQCIYEKEGLELTESAKLNWLFGEGYGTKDLDGIIYQHGKGHVNHMIMEQVVLDKLIQ